jgi:serine/threonine protein kinase/tetratricopeptide (TPR) repeat protein
MIGETIGHYRIIQQIGTGGMGAVYRAHDERLDRDVALKVVLPGPPNGTSRDQLRKEALILSKLNHPNIAQVFDFDNQDGVDFLVMEYVTGTTLAKRLEQGAIPEETAIAWGIQIASAIEKTAEVGIVHHDLKPSNAMVTPKGTVKVLDFGLARMFRIPDNELTQSLDNSSEAAGTLPYMAPEQLKGERADFRSDIYALGVILYEAVTGKRPFGSRSTVTLIGEILDKSPVPPRQVNPSVSPVLENAIVHCLAKEPGRRYQSASELRAVLESIQGRRTEIRNLSPSENLRPRRLASIAFLVSVILGAGFFAIRGSPERLVKVDAAEPAELAVLPLSMSGASGESDAFSNGLIETLTSRLIRLSRDHALQVVPASEIRESNVKTLQEANRRFGATLGLQVSVERAGDLVRVNYALVDAKKHRQLQGDTITVPASDPFGLEDKVADSVVKALQIELQPDERKAFAEHGTTSPSAYDFYLQGKGYLQDFQKPANIDNAIAEFNHALEQDPNYALASAGLGDAYWEKYKITRDSAWVKRAKSACDRAVTLEDAEAAGHACLGTVYTGTGAYEKAIEQFRVAADLQPTDDLAYKGLAYAYERLNKPEEAEQIFKKAISLRSNYWANYNWLGELYFRQGNFKEAEKMFSEVARLTPDSYIGYGNLGITYLSEGEYTKAVAMLERSVSIQPNAENTSNLAALYFQQRRFADAARLNESAVKLNDQNYEVWGNLGDAYYWSPGERSKAVPAYSTAIKLANEQLKVNPRNANLLGYVAGYYAMISEQELAMDYIRRGLAIAPSNADLLFSAALVYNQFGKKRESLDYLTKAVAAGLSAPLLTDTPNLDNLHTEPRYQELLAQSRDTHEVRK